MQRKRSDALPGDMEKPLSQIDKEKRWRSGRKTGTVATLVAERTIVSLEEAVLVMRKMGFL